MYRGNKRTAQQQASANFIKHHIIVTIHEQCIEETKEQHSNKHLQFSSNIISSFLIHEQCRENKRTAQQQTSAIFIKHQIIVTIHEQCKEKTKELHSNKHLQFSSNIISLSRFTSNV
jgi:hypothetical protein